MKNIKQQPTQPRVVEALNGRISLNRPFTLQLPAFETAFPPEEIFVILHAGYIGGDIPHQASMRLPFTSGAVHEQTFDNASLAYPFVPGDRVEFNAHMIFGDHWTLIPSTATYECVEDLG